MRVFADSQLPLFFNALRDVEVGFILDAVSINHRRPLDKRVRLSASAREAIDLLTERFMEGDDDSCYVVAFKPTTIEGIRALLCLTPSTERDEEWTELYDIFYYGSRDLALLPSQLDETYAVMTEE
jgi:hypothetical protein